MTGIRRVSDLGTRGAVNIVDGSIQTADIANNAVTQAKLDTAIPLSGFRNAVINGSFDVWQRGVGPINTSGGGVSNYSADRWRFGNNGTASQYNISQVSNTSSAPCVYALRLTSARTSDGLNGLEYLMEYKDVAKLRGSVLTLSFWVRASTNTTFSTSIGTGTLTTDAYPGVGNGLTGAVQIGSSSVAATTSWQRVSITTSAVSDSAGQLRIILVGAIALTNGVWLEFAGVQLEIGSQVTPFEQRPYGVELALCQRYYEHNYGFGYAVGSASAYPYNQPTTAINGYTTASQQKFIYTPLLCEKRAVPSITIYDTAGNNGKLTTLDAGGTGTNNVNVGISSTTHKMIGYAPGAGTYAGYAYFYVANAEL